MHDATTGHRDRPRTTRSGQATRWTLTTWSTSGLAGRVAEGRRASDGRSRLTEKVLVGHLRPGGDRVPRPGGPTSTSTRTASPSKTPSPRSWPCSS